MKLLIPLLSNHFYRSLIERLVKKMEREREMSFCSIVCDVRVSFGSLPRRSLEFKLSSLWPNLPPELLLDVIKRLEESESVWPGRRYVLRVCSKLLALGQIHISCFVETGWLGLQEMLPSIEQRRADRG